MDKQTHYHITYGFSPKHYVEIRHTKITSDDLQKITDRVGSDPLVENDQFKGMSGEQIINEASTKFLLGIEANVPEKFHVYDISETVEQEIQEILSSYPDTFKMSSPEQIFLSS